ncbi:MAG: hypothetical protein A2Y10_11210 [Planctomycetes bacterium GWF2_41_51]|nr:MAG: hypothetical protein A2Y10_11210 [Planctomycetes bacterium GWF2_41_51]HBG28382.1 hypothetical protein [Phycisphaerales bacterium]
MTEDAKKQDQLLETTDCLEAIGTLKSNKNLFFFVCLICLLVLQGCFWLMATNHVELTPQEPNESKIDAAIKTIFTETASPNSVDSNDPNSKAADPNTNWQKYSEKLVGAKIGFNKIGWAIRICNYLLIISSIIYSMSMLFGLMISIVGRLGGISHITKAFFISLLFIVILMPWQALFRSVAIGAIFKPAELLASWQIYPDANVFSKTFIYLRFVALPVFAILLLLWAQLKSMRWAKNTLKRLGIVG